MFVAIARIPSDPAALQKAAAITGLALADVSRLLAGTLPRILVRATEESERIIGALEAAGFIALVGTEANIISDKDRVVARNLELLPEGLVAIDGRGQRQECLYPAITSLLRGFRRVESTEITKTTKRKLDVGKALLSGGLLLTKKVETVSETTTSAKESFILIQCAKGLPEIVLYEHKVNYQCLGTDIQLSTLGNQAALLKRLQSHASQASLDDRLARPGFVVGLPTMAADPVDLAVYLVTLARAHGC
jgi:hypothetical protein